MLVQAATVPLGWVLVARGACWPRSWVFWAGSGWCDRIAGAQLFPNEFEAATALLDLSEDRTVSEAVRKSLEIHEVSEAMRSRSSCPWCHEMNDIVPGAINLCRHCCHEVTRPRIACRCLECRKHGQAATATGRIAPPRLVIPSVN